MDTASLLPGTWGAAHGQGFPGDLIREVEVLESKSTRFPQGDHEASWAGHVVVYVGGGMIVQAEWPHVLLSPASVHPDTIWASRQPLTEAQRAAGVAAVRALIGTPYDAASYAYFLMKLAEIPLTHDFVALEAARAKAGPICSGLMVREQEAMGVDLGELQTAAIQDPDFVSPADCLRWMLGNGWNDRAVPVW